MSVYNALLMARMPPSSRSVTVEFLVSLALGLIDTTSNRGPAVGAACCWPTDVVTATHHIAKTTMPKRVRRAMSWPPA